MAHGRAGGVRHRRRSGRGSALGWGLWESRNLPFVADIGTLLAHREVGGYTLSMSHFFDLTGPSFAALRLPAVIAALDAADRSGRWLDAPRSRQKHMAATTSSRSRRALFLVAAHIAFARFDPMLSSKQLADTIVAKGSPSDSFIIYGDQSDASSVVFYTHDFLRKPAYIVLSPAPRTATAHRCVWGSCYPDAPRYLLQRRPAFERVGHRRTQMALRAGSEPSEGRATPCRPALPGPVHRRQSAVDRPAPRLSCRPSSNFVIRQFHARSGWFHRSVEQFGVRRAIR